MKKYTDLAYGAMISGLGFGNSGTTLDMLYPTCFQMKVFHMDTLWHLLLL